MNNFIGHLVSNIPIFLNTWTNDTKFNKIIPTTTKKASTFGDFSTPFSDIPTNKCYMAHFALNSTGMCENGAYLSFNGRLGICDNGYP